MSSSKASQYRRPRMALVTQPAGQSVTRIVRPSDEVAVGFHVRTHLGTRDTHLLDVTITEAGEVYIAVRRAHGFDIECVGTISADGLEVVR